MHHRMPLGGKFGPEGSTALDSNQIILAFTRARDGGLA